MAGRKLAVTSKSTGDLDAGTIKSVSVGLRGAEIDALDQIAADLDVPRNQIMHFGLRWFLIEYQAGRVDLQSYIEEPPPAKKNIRLP